MQNKPNSRKAKMKLNFYSTKDYENKPRLRAPAKQSQNKPNQTQFQKGALLLLRLTILIPLKKTMFTVLLRYFS